MFYDYPTPIAYTFGQLSKCLRVTARPFVGQCECFNSAICERLARCMQCLKKLFCPSLIQRMSKASCNIDD
ncbi:hypothetical protein CR159_17145 [Pollutimonas subterranea]|uniref:Uncharacterized protein n=1 Tax=Pollutimonas subterranea TaxID=2045210 RepID=A0A2N4U111_9BURK|nr:hypothetical protein CR159_17145 [Pollutimonas subterranea]